MQHGGGQKTILWRSPRLRSKRKSMRDYAALLSGIRPQTAFASWRTLALTCGSLRNENLSHQRLKSWFFLQWIKHWIDFQEDDVEPGSVLVAAFETFDCLILLPQCHVQKREAVRWNVAVRRDLRQLRQ